MDAVYCTVCGSKLDEKRSGRFDTQSGAHVMGKVCRKCHPCDHQWIELPWWNLFHDYRCALCGENMQRIAPYY